MTIRLAFGRMPSVARRLCAMLSPLFIIWKLTRMLRWLPFGIALGGKRGGGWFPMFFKVSELLRDGGG